MSGIKENCPIAKEIKVLDPSNNKEESRINSVFDYFEDLENFVGDIFSIEEVINDE